MLALCFLKMLFIKLRIFLCIPELLRAFIMNGYSIYLVIKPLFLLCFIHKIITSSKQFQEVYSVWLPRVLSGKESACSAGDTD